MPNDVAIDDVTAFRRQLHTIPEPAGEEFETSKLIREKLVGLGITPFAPLIGTDVVADISGEAGPGPCVALRADIDALAIEEKTGLAYASRHKGFMHACGHDGHTAMLMGAAAELWRRRKEFGGTVRLIWQPGEEGKAMARQLVAAGVLERVPKPAMITALHGDVSLSVGSFGLRNGAIMASSAHFYITIKGKGGHSSRPHLAIDPILAAAEFVLKLRANFPLSNDQVVVTTCTIKGGEMSNVIPDEVKISGTCRTLSGEMERIVEMKFRALLEEFSAAYGTTYDLVYDAAYHVVLNDPSVTDISREVIRRAFGAGHLVELSRSSMGAEDFGSYLQYIPGVYVKVGVAPRNGELHNCYFDFNDASLPYGVRYLVEWSLAALKELA